METELSLPSEMINLSIQAQKLYIIFLDKKLYPPVKSISQKDDI